MKNIIYARYKMTKFEIFIDVVNILTFQNFKYKIWYCSEQYRKMWQIYANILKYAFFTNYYAG